MLHKLVKIIFKTFIIVIFTPTQTIG